MKAIYAFMIVCCLVLTVLEYMWGDKLMCVTMMMCTLANFLNLLNLTNDEDGGRPA